MIIFLDASGNIVVPKSPEPIGRCSNDASVIYIVSPLPEGVDIYLTFTLPNGEPLFGNLAEPTKDTLERDARQAATYLFGTGNLSAWRYKVPGAVTQYAGTVHYTVCAVSETVRATASGTFTVSRGSKIILPDGPTAAQWDDVLAALEHEEADRIDVWAAMFGKDGTPDAPKEGSLASKVKDLEMEFGEIPGWSEDAEGDTLAYRDANGRVRTATHLDLERFKTAHQDDSVSLGDVRAFLPYDFALHMDSGTYVLSLTVKNMNGDQHYHEKVDLPLETMVVDATVSEDGKSIILSLKNGNEVSVDVSAIVGGLVNEDTFKTEMEKKVDKITATWMAYTTDGNGKTASKPLAAKPSSGGVVLYNEGGILKTNAPAEDNDAANRKFVEDGLAGKVSAQKFTSGKNRMYCARPNNPNSYYEMDSKPWLDCIPVYTDIESNITPNASPYGQATIVVADPKHPYQAANRRFVERTVAPLQRDVNTLIQVSAGVLYQEESLEDVSPVLGIPEGWMSAITLDMLGPSISTRYTTSDTVAPVSNSQTISGVTITYDPDTEIYTLNGQGTDEYGGGAVIYVPINPVSINPPLELDRYTTGLEVVGGSYTSMWGSPLIFQFYGEDFATNSISVPNEVGLFVSAFDDFSDKAGEKLTKFAFNLSVDMMTYNNFQFKLFAPSVDDVVVTAVPVSTVKEITDGDPVLYEVPEEVLNLKRDGVPVYGLGTGSGAFNYIDFERKEFVINVIDEGSGLTQIPEERIDISAYLGVNAGEITVSTVPTCLRFGEHDGSAEIIEVPKRITGIIKLLGGEA